MKGNGVSQCQWDVGICRLVIWKSRTNFFDASKTAIAVNSNSFRHSRRSPDHIDWVQNTGRDHRPNSETTQRDLKVVELRLTKNRWVEVHGFHVLPCNGDLNWMMRVVLIFSVQRSSFARWRCRRNLSLRNSFSIQKPKTWNAVHDFITTTEQPWVTTKQPREDDSKPSPVRGSCHLAATAHQVTKYSPPHHNNARIIPFWWEFQTRQET
jgi:hypothetical protein